MPKQEAPPSPPKKTTAQVRAARLAPKPCIDHQQVLVVVVKFI